MCKFTGKSFQILHFDHIVVGLGSMGSSTLYQLSKRGKSVLGLEQFQSPHEKGSHGGQSRIIRMAYYEHPDYIPLLQKAYNNWDILEKESGKKIFHRTGLYYTGPVTHDIIHHVKESAQAYQIELEKKKLPHIYSPDHWETILEPDAGFLKPELAVKTFLEEAQKNGATILQHTSVLEWKREGKIVIVYSDKGTFSCNKIIFTAGPWTSSLLKETEKHLSITRQLLVWIKVQDKEKYAPDNFPCWFIVEENKPGAYYGFPWMGQDAYNDVEGLKFAYHYPGEMTDPDKVNREIDDMELNDIRDIVHKYFRIEPNIAFAKTCLYSNTPDEHFVIDNMPGMEENVCYAWGFSGHGFKFVSVVGEILADLAIDGTTSLPIDFLKAGRFAR
ncbi:MAG: N-methyl-L-tryptophan oxidase [Chitinophagaceae bacterium]